MPTVRAALRSSNAALLAALAALAGLAGAGCGSAQETPAAGSLPAEAAATATAPASVRATTPAPLPEPTLPGEPPPPPPTTPADYPASASSRVPATTRRCGEWPAIELVANEHFVVADLHYFSEQAPPCGMASDGISMFDSTFRPARALPAVDGWFAVIVPERADVTLTFAADDGGESPAYPPRSADVLAASEDGSYVVELPGEGCFAVKLGWRTDTTDGEFIALVESAAGLCVVGPPTG